MKKILSILFFVWVAYLLFTTSCANPGMPTGGNKDSIPPVVLRTEPDFNARNYKGHSVSLTFDEFIISDEISTELMVSPPLKKKPVLRTKSKTLTIDLGKDLHPNTTYSLDFKNAIVDNNEKNPLKDFRFAFSTGPEFDSLMIGGYVINAKDVDPVEGALVLLYAADDSLSAFNDSLPAYIAKTDDKGFYAVTNIAAGKYHLYALEDADNSYTFNQPGERVAFFDSLVVPQNPEVIKVTRADSLSAGEKKDEAGAAIDSLISAGQRIPDNINPDSLRASGEKLIHGAVTVIDSIYQGRQAKQVKVVPYILSMFEEESNDQFLDSYDREKGNLIRFYFTHPVTDSFRVDLISPIPSPDWSYLEYGYSRDTVTLWVNDTIISKTDTLKLKLQYLALDTLENTFVKKDTLDLVYTEPVQKERRRRKKDEPKIVQPFPFKHNAADAFDPYNPLILLAPEPLDKFDYSKVYLYHTVDTLEERIPFEIKQDSSLHRKYTIGYPWVFEDQYRLEVDSAAAKTYPGQPSARINQNFRIQKEAYYGKIFLDIKNVQGSCIVELLKNTDKEEVLQKIILEKDGEVEFPFIKPEKYKIRLIIDRNQNGQWDTGDLEKWKQPERVVYYSKILKIRSNFEVHETWVLPEDLQFSKKLIDEEKNDKDTKGSKKPRSR